MYSDVSFTAKDLLELFSHAPRPQYSQFRLLKVYCTFCSSLTLNRLETTLENSENFDSPNIYLLNGCILSTMECNIFH